MALHAVRRRAAVVCLATFVPESGSFRAHPLAMMSRQAAAMGLRHARSVVRPPYRDGYRRALERLRSRFSLDAVVTGDIDRVEGRPNWIREIAEPLGLRVFTPLWGEDRRSLLERHWRAGFRAVISYVNAPLGEEWVGRELDRAAVRDLSRIRGVDLCGENGEYHTMVIDGPGFRRALGARVGRSFG